MFQKLLQVFDGLFFPSSALEEQKCDVNRDALISLDLTHNLSDSGQPNAPNHQSGQAFGFRSNLCFSKDQIKLGMDSWELWAIRKQLWDPTGCGFSPQQPHEDPQAQMWLPKQEGV